MRTGRMFACELYGAEPDIVVIGNSLRSGGHPAAYVARADFDYQERERDSLTGVSAVDCVAALQTIDVLKNLDELAFTRKINSLCTIAPEWLGMMRRICFSDKKTCDEVIDRAWQASSIGLILIPTFATADYR